MREIASDSNRQYKLFQKLATKKYRDRYGLYLIEGENLIREAVQNGAKIDSVIVRDDAAEKYLRADGPLADGLLAMAGALPAGSSRTAADAEQTAGSSRPAADAAQTGGQPEVFVLSGRLFAALALTETSQGVLAAVRMPQLSLANIGPDHLKPGSNVLVLDRLQDQGNIGTVIRTADAAGYKAVIALKGTADLFAPKTVRAAAGSLFRVRLALAETEEELLRFTRAAGKKLAAACPAGSRYYYEEDLSHDIALVLGNEGNGISGSLLEKADVKIKIPMSGSIESLNVAAAAAILMYEAVRGRARADFDM